jgi:hypothetical protein
MWTQIYSLFFNYIFINYDTTIYNLDIYILNIDLMIVSYYLSIIISSWYWILKGDLTILKYLIIENCNNIQYKY